MLIKFLKMKIINAVWKAVHGMDATLSQRVKISMQIIELAKKIASV